MMFGADIENVHASELAIMSNQHLTLDMFTLLINEVLFTQLQLPMVPILRIICILATL